MNCYEQDIYTEYPRIVPR